MGARDGKVVLTLIIKKKSEKFRLKVLRAGSGTCSGRARERRKIYIKAEIELKGSSDTDKVISVSGFKRGGYSQPGGTLSNLREKKKVEPGEPS